MNSRFNNSSHKSINKYIRLNKEHFDRKHWANVFSKFGAYALVIFKPYSRVVQDVCCIFMIPYLYTHRATAHRVASLSYEETEERSARKKKKK